MRFMPHSFAQAHGAFRAKNNGRKALRDSGWLHESQKGIINQPTRNLIGIEKISQKSGVGGGSVELPEPPGLPKNPNWSLSI